MNHFERIAKVCHEVNRAYCHALGDYSQAPWNLSPEWQKKSAIDGVEFHLNNPTADESESHVRWSLQKVADGWVWGPVKDAEKKEHPCLVPYGELPVEQRAKDFLFKATVHAVAEALKDAK